MYNLSEYIILSRSAFLLEKTNISFIQEDNNYNYDSLYNIEENMESLFSYLYDGISISKFIVIRNEEMVDRKYFPIYLLEIPSFKDGKTLFLPMVITHSGLIGIETIFRYSDSVVEQPFLLDVFSIYPLKDRVGPVKFLEYLKEADINNYDLNEIKELLNSYFDRSGYILNTIDNTYSNISEFNIHPVSLDSEYDKYAKYIKNSYILDTPRENKIESMPIRPEMFMPLIIKRTSSYSSSVTNETLGIFYSTKKDSEGSLRITTSKVTPISKMEEIDSLQNDTNETPGDFPNKIIVNVPEGCEYVIIDSTCMVYTGNGKLFSTIVDPTLKDIGVMNYIDLNKMVIGNNFEENIYEESPYLNPIQENSSNESLKDDMKKMIEKGKEVGMNFRSDMMPYLRKLIGLPKDIVEIAYKFILRIFNKANDMEKNKALDYQEKLLNDEISEFSETMEKMLTNTVIAIAALMIPTNLMIQVMIFLIGKSVNESIRVRALERMEHRLEDIIDRLDKKIEFANQDYDKKAVNELKKQRSLYVFAFERILKVKQKVYNKGRKASAFKDFENYKEEGK